MRMIDALNRSGFQGWGEAMPRLDALDPMLGAPKA